VRFENVCPKSGVSSPTTNRGPQDHFFRRFRHSLNGKFNAYIFGNKHDIHNRASAWKLRGVSHIVSKCHVLWSTNSLKLNRRFYPPSVNSAFYFTAAIRRRRSANGTRPNFAKRWVVIPKKLGVKNFIHLFGVWTTST